MTGLPLRPWNGFVPILSLVTCLGSVFLMALGAAAFWVSRTGQAAELLAMRGSVQPVFERAGGRPMAEIETSGSAPDVSVIQSPSAALAADAGALQAHTAPVVIFTVEDGGQVWLEEPRGAVELGEGGEWRMLALAESGLAEQSAAGQRVRTGANSSVLLRFSDGRQALLGGESEVWLYPLDERTLALVLYRGAVVRRKIP